MPGTLFFGGFTLKRFGFLIVCALAAVPFLMAADDAKPRADKDGFYSLFDGKSLDGWKVNESPETFKVEDGAIVVNGKRSHAFYEGPVAKHDFKNFHFKAEVMCMPKSNSGIYFHTEFQKDGWPAKGFEAQVNNTHGDPKKTAGLYNVKDVMNDSPAKDNEWFTYEIIVKGDTVKILINEKVANEWTQPADWKGTKDQANRKLSSGTFALQGHDPVSKVLYRKIMVKPLD
jgi:hypothetical protein